MAEIYQKYLDPRTLARLQGLDLRARHVVDGFVSGMHRSPYHGFSVEFAEHREYTPGDDLRHVDWKAFGRTDKFYLKRYEDETNLVCYLLLDTSESMKYRGPGMPMSKLEYAQCIAVLLAWLVLRQQDAVSLVTFDHAVRKLVPPSAGPSHMKQLIHVMEETQAEHKTSTGPIFHQLAERFKKRGLIIVLSDLFDDLSPMMAGLKHFRHQRHEVAVFHVLDPAEIEFPFQRPTLFRGLEQLPEVLTEPRSLRKAYLEELNRFLGKVARECRNQQIEYSRITTDQALDVALSTFLSKRAIRSA